MHFAGPRNPDSPGVKLIGSEEPRVGWSGSSVALHHIDWLRSGGESPVGVQLLKLGLASDRFQSSAQLSLSHTYTHACTHTHTHTHTLPVSISGSQLTTDVNE